MWHPQHADIDLLNEVLQEGYVSTAPVKVDSTFPQVIFTLAQPYRKYFGNKQPVTETRYFDILAKGKLADLALKLSLGQFVRLKGELIQQRFDANGTPASKLKINMLHLKQGSVSDTPVSLDHQEAAEACDKAFAAPLATALPPFNPDRI